MGESMPDGWRVCWMGGWDKGRVCFLVMVARKIAAANLAAEKTDSEEIMLYDFRSDARTVRSSSWK